ncbi:GGDEF domain-containing protein [Sporosarcina sp. FSL W7-1349]|uniref:GGDEF domain-containing protein n=1 Tax=Sporosarcina sp. FSL W7-1349 TaxID=2921561 RepID=UPI0030F619FB
MKKHFDVEIRPLILFALLLLGMQITLFLLLQEGRTGLLMSAFLTGFVVLSLVAGPLVGLFSSVLFIFIIGTILVYMALPSSSLSVETLSMPLSHLLGYGFSLLIFVLLAGQLHERIAGQGRLTRQLQEELRQFVAVDTETGFDNKYRMAMELEAEMKRIDRYGGAFTLVLIQIDFFNEFLKLYGEKEQKHLLHSLADTMQTIIRSTDRKFRYATDRFALLLTHTNDTSIETVYDKLASAIKHHQLLNEKYITLSFRAGHAVYNGHAKTTDHAILVSQVESEMVAREL